MHSSLKKILAAFEAHANPAIVAKYSRYFSEGYDAYGLDREILETLFKGWLEDGTIPSAKKAAFTLCDELFAHEKYESASLAYLIVKLHLDSACAADLKRLKKWFDHDIRNWGHTDVICGELLSVYHLKGIATFTALVPWLNSASRWTRRAVPVTLIAAAKQKGADIPALIAFVSPLSHDPERVVHQGLGWFLRECWKKNAPATESFLLTIKDSAPRLIIQYATEKIPKEERQRFRKTKS